MATSDGALEMARTRLKTKGRRESGHFVILPGNILTSSEYAALSPYALKLLVDLLAQYKGFNNGDLCATWSMMKRCGWKSRDTLARTVKELLASGFIVKTRQGEKGHSSGHRVPTLYAITWLGIDECGGKLDIASSPVPMNTWKQKNSITRLPCHTDTPTVLKVASTG